MYLSQRGWDVFATSDMKEFLNYLATNRPDFVLICLDYPNSHIKSVPKMIHERIRSCVIATACKSNLETHRKVQESGMEYKIIPPLSGSAVEKIAERYMAKLQSLLEKQNQTKNAFVLDENRKSENLKIQMPELVLDYKNMKGQNGLLRNKTITFDIGELQSQDPKVENYDSILRATERVVAEYVGGASIPANDGDEFVQATEVTCMQVDTLNFSGYLVAAMGNKFKQDDSFGSMVYGHLKEFLSQNGEVILDDSDSFNIQIKPVAFLDWAKEYAEFLRRAIHKGNQIAFAFFPFKGVRAAYGASAADDMLSVPISEFMGDSRVNFDIYLYLSANKKYILYTPRNALFFSKQQKKLAEKGITHLHIKRVDLKELNKYKAQKYFNTIIDEYHKTNFADIA